MTTIINGQPTTIIIPGVAGGTVVSTSPGVGPPGATGPQGPQGPDAGISTSVALAALGGHRVVRFISGGVDYADCSDSSHLRSPMGVTSGAASSGASIAVVVEGLLTEPTWSWTPNQSVFLSTTGLLTQTAPTAPAFLKVMGTAITATQMYVLPQPSIVLT